MINAETLLSAAREKINSIARRHSLEEILQQKKVASFGDKLNVENVKELFPVPLLVIGSKYDIFKVRLSVVSFARVC